MGRKTTEVKYHFHCIVSSVHTIKWFLTLDVHIEHSARWCLSGFLKVKLLFYPPSCVVLLEVTVYTQTWVEFCSTTSLGANYQNKLFRVLHGRFVFFPPYMHVYMYIHICGIMNKCINMLVCIYPSNQSLYEYKYILMDIYFILWVITQYYFIILLKLFWLWPSGALSFGSSVPLTYSHHCVFLIFFLCTFLSTFLLSGSIRCSRLILCIALIWQLFFYCAWKIRFWKSRTIF